MTESVMFHTTSVLQENSKAYPTKPRFSHKPYFKKACHISDLQTTTLPIMDDEMKKKGKGGRKERERLVFAWLEDSAPKTNIALYVN